MLDLISHVVEISSHRDRTEINAAMVDALIDLFHPQQICIYRCYTSKKKTIVFPCAGAGPKGNFVRNAYLPDHTHCFKIERNPLLNRCRREMSAAIDFTDDGLHRIAFPVIRLNEPVYIIELTLSDEFSADQRVTLMGLIEYFGNHIALLDYGETDTLTDLFSRKTFDKHLFELLGKASHDDLKTSPKGAPARRLGEQATANHWLAICDIDHFKQINDTYGHLIGDEVLILLAQLMRQSFRFDDQLFRFGGEEFIALLQPVDMESALATLERFRENVETEIFSRVGHVTISIGFSRLLPNDTPTDVIDRADEALYFAKNNGRNQVASYETRVLAGDLVEKDITKGEVELF